VNLFPELLNKQIKRITAHLYDRVLKIEFVDDLQLKMNLYGSASSNIFLVDLEDVVRNSFKNSKEFIGKDYREISKSRNFEAEGGIFLNYKRFEEKLLADGTKPTFPVLKSVYPFIGSTLAREALHRCGIEDKVHISELTNDDCKNIYQKLTELFIEMSKPHPTIYYTEDIPRVLSMIQLQHMSGSRQESFTTANEAIRTFVIKSFSKHDIDAEKKELLIKIRNELDRARRSENATNREVVESKRADEYEHLAKVIMSNLQHLTKGTKEIDIEDVFNDNKLIHVILDPKLTPAQNAEKYFDKARKTRELYKVASKRSNQGPGCRVQGRIRKRFTKITFDSLEI
jgi:predicted ribosome quality control (RQC) complex YloA/Tae2 family protein